MSLLLLLCNIGAYNKHNNAVYIVHSFDRQQVCQYFAAIHLVSPASSLRGVLAPPRGLFREIQLSVQGMKKGKLNLSYN